MKQGWEIKKLGEVCESDLGKTLNQSKDTGELRPYLCAVNVLWDKIDFATLKETRFENAELERYTIKKGDLLICEGGDIGRAAIWNYDYEIQYQNALHRVRLDDSILPRFLLLYLKHLKDSGVLDTRYGKGVTIKHLVKSSLLSIPVPVPPREEQERIVAELDCLSGVIERKREQLRELDALTQSIFYQMFGDPITNEKRWEVKKLGEVGKVITGNTPSTKDEENYSSNDYCFVKPSDIGKDYVTKIENTEFYISEKAFSQSRRLSKGSVLTTCIGIIGKVGILKVDATCNQQINAILPDENSISEYVAWAIYLTRSVLENIANAPVVPIINKGEFSNIVIPLPPKVLQQEFADKIEAIEKQKELIKQSITQTEELFNSRMDYYFN